MSSVIINTLRCFAPTRSPLLPPGSERSRWVCALNGNRWKEDIPCFFKIKHSLEEVKEEAYTVWRRSLVLNPERDSNPGGTDTPTDILG